MGTCAFFTINIFLIILGICALLWSTIEYSSAYEVVPTKCQHIKHVVTPGHNVLNGYSIVCWNLIGIAQYPPTENGPVTWCKGLYVSTSRNYDEIMTKMKNEYPITNPPTYFDCYHAKNDHRYMFVGIPDTTSWKRDMNISILLVFCSCFSLLIYYVNYQMDCCKKIITPPCSPSSETSQTIPQEKLKTQ